MTENWLWGKSGVENQVTEDLLMFTNALAYVFLVIASAVIWGHRKGGKRGRSYI